ncbi:hypothetical protein EUGRSUZ_E00799 [Eucalyptus grandis]|uniref:Uncharacterized protein n=2 Tax=Eucalyptus grandis TaxID=71139 RepID=A0ACC3KSV5_EUCGR|nr:hypothetical protein EUGRSUZ_E00799 [Eucalyptus grandis]
MNFIYGGVQVGQAIIPKSKANFMSTKKINVKVTLNSANLPSDSNLGSNLSSKIINLNSQGEFKGKIRVMFMFKKRKTSQMNCTMAINTTTKAVQSLLCK